MLVAVAAVVFVVVPPSTVGVEWCATRIATANCPIVVVVVVVGQAMRPTAANPSRRTNLVTAEEEELEWQ